ncbi:MAG: (Fe-S)-binding protein, partial [Terriglobales bacterium]
QAPPLLAPPFDARREPVEAFPPVHARVLFLPGCAQCELLPELNRATVRVLARQGCEVVMPPAFGCCGALHVHAGLRQQARALARANLAALEPLAASAAAVIVNAAGCGAALKAYGDLLESDAAWRPRALAFAARVRDVTEFLDQLGLRPELLGPLPAVATYQDACHLAHAQGVRAAPRNLLRQIPALELRELERADQCCGSAGVYNLTQPDLARQLLADRVEVFRRTGATILATANPGCSLQLASALPPPVTVAHVVELLDQSHRAAL